MITFQPYSDLLQAFLKGLLLLIRIFEVQVLVQEQVVIKDFVFLHLHNFLDLIKEVVLILFLTSILIQVTSSQNDLLDLNLLEFHIRRISLQALKYLKLRPFLDKEGYKNDLSFSIYLRFNHLKITHLLMSQFEVNQILCFLDDKDCSYLMLVYFPIHLDSLISCKMNFC